MNGTVKNLKKEKGFGFVKGDDGKEYFFHVSGMVDKGEFDTLMPDDAVQFNIDASGTRGLRAKDVKRIA